VNAYDQIVLFAVELLALAFVAIGVAKGCFRRHVYLQLYIACMVLGDVVRFFCLRAYGLRSNQYYLTYFLADYFVIVLKYLAVLSIFEIILEGSPLREIARRAFLLLFVVLAVLSCGLLPNSSPNMLAEFQQNIHFAVVVLTAMLCLTLAHLRVANPQLRTLVYGFGVSAAMQAIGWALRLLISQDLMSEVARRLGPLAAVIMLALWCYALLRVPSVESVDDEVSGQSSGREEPSLIPVLLRWGRTTAIRIYCDTALLTQVLERNAACGVAEAVAAPIVDEP